MAFQPVAATCLAELVFEMDGQTIENTLYFRRANSYTVTDLNAVGDALINWWNTNMKPIISIECSLVRVVVTALHDQAGPQVVRVGALPSAGGVAGDAVPNNCALCVSLRTALIGRSFRGRNYVAGLAESNTNGSYVLTANAEAIRTAYGLIQAAVGGAGNTWVVVSRVVNGVVQLPSALTNAVTSVVLVDEVIDSQRRRLPKRGT